MMRREMKRYQGASKPPGPTLSPPPYSRAPTSRYNAQPTPTTSNRPSKAPTSPMSMSRYSGSGDQDPFLVRGASATPAFIDPRTKQPVMLPPAGRSIPKLKMEDLTTSLAPLVESQLTPGKSPMNMTQKRINRTMKEIAKKKDLLESFDDKIKSPDLSLINTKVARLRRTSVASGPVNIPPITSRIGGDISPKVKNASMGEGSQKRTTPRNKTMKAEQNVKRLMGQLRDKYLDEMESQLGLAMDRRSLGVLTGPVKDESDYRPHLSGVLPRPSTNAAEITSRIDKVVKEWSYEAQQLSKTVKPSDLKGQLNPKQKGKLEAAPFPAAASTSPKSVAGRNKEKEGRLVPTSQATAVANNTVPDEPKEKNKNLAKISTAFKRNLDKYTAKMDVRELIKIPEDDHVEKLEAEHEERRKAHEAVFKNVLTLDVEPGDVPIVEVEDEDEDMNENDARNNNNNNALPPPGPPPANRKKESVKALEREQRHPKGQEMKGSRASASAVAATAAAGKIPFEEPKKNAKQDFMESIKMAKDDENEVYTIIKDHIAYEMASGPPKLTPQRKNNMTIRRPSKSPPRMMHSDLNYEAHKKLQTLVDSFSEKATATRATMDAGTTPREIELLKKSTLGIGGDGTETEFKFVPDMSYTDQLMLQKLRKMKEKEGWGDSLSVKVSELMEDMDKMIGEAPSREEIATRIRKITHPELQAKPAEKISKGQGGGPPMSMNAVLRARMNKS